MMETLGMPRRDFLKTLAAVLVLPTVGSSDLLDTGEWRRLMPGEIDHVTVWGDSGDVVEVYSGFPTSPDILLGLVAIVPLWEGEANPFMVFEMGHRFMSFDVAGLEAYTVHGAQGWHARRDGIEVDAGGLAP